jgi:hypothetical protein
MMWKIEHIFTQDNLFDDFHVFRTRRERACEPDQHANYH